MAKSGGEGKKEQAVSVSWTKDSAEVKALHVMLLPDGHGWFAQGLEIDYASSGKTEEEARDNFVKGLGATLCENLVMYGHIKKVLAPASQEAWKEYYETPPQGIKRNTLSLKATFEMQHAEPEKIEEVEKAFPFNAIQFVRGEAATA